MTHRLIAIGPSHFVEKARWALHRHGVPFVEEPHVPMFHWRATRPHGRRTVPLLLLDDGTKLGESTEIARWVDRTHPTEAPLFPADRDDEVTALVEHLDRKLGVHARKAAYGATLGSRAAIVSTFSGSPPLEVAALRVGFPVFRSMLVKGLGLTPDRIARSVDRVRELFAEASARLASSPYLVGDTFTAADLTFAAHGALVILPPEYGWPMPDLDAGLAAGGWPGLAEAVALRDELRATPAGRHVLAVYASERRKVLPSVVPLG